MLLGIVQGFVFGFIVLFYKKYRALAAIYLALTAVCLSFANLQPILIDMKVTEGNFFALKFYLPWDWLVLPFLYFFTKSYSRINIKQMECYILFSPFVLLTTWKALQLAYGFESNKTVEWTFAIREHLFWVVQNAAAVFSLILVFLIFRCIHKYNVNVQKNDRNTLKRDTRWLQTFLIFTTIACFLWIIAGALTKYYETEHLYYYYPFWILVSALIYIMTYIGVSKSIIINERTSIRKKHENSVRIKKPSTARSSALFTRFNEVVFSENLYLTPGITLIQIAETLGVSQAHLSQTINNCSNLSFVDLINSSRVDYAKNLLADKEFQNYTIISIALEAGFSSKSAFYHAFKKHTGFTPSDFRKNLNYLVVN